MAAFIPIQGPNCISQISTKCSNEINEQADIQDFADFLTDFQGF
jgi:hypothetical protein